MSSLTRKEISKSENKKSLGVIYEMFRKQEYKPIGPKTDELKTAKIKNNSLEIFVKEKSLDELKTVLWEQVGPQIRAKAWRYLFKYIPLNSANEEQMLTKKRLEYQEYVDMNTEDKFQANNDAEVLETIKLIKKDIHRTLPTSLIFRNSHVQDCLCRVLLIYSIRQANQTSFERVHPGNERHSRANLRSFSGRPI